MGNDLYPDGEITPNPEAFAWARSYLSAAAVSKAYEVESEEAASALRLLSLEVAAPRQMSWSVEPLLGGGLTFRIGDRCLNAA